MDSPTVAQIADKVFRTTFPRELEARGLFQEYFYPYILMRGVHTGLATTESNTCASGIWVLSNRTQPKVPIVQFQRTYWQLAP